MRTQVIQRSGKLIDPLKPQPGDIVVQDIAHALAHECRWRGVLGWRSVAWHSLAVSALLRQRGYGVKTQLIGLLHDAAESFIGDIAKPLKDGYLLEAALVEEAFFANIWAALVPGVTLPNLHMSPLKVADADVSAFEYQHYATPAMRETWMPTYGCAGGLGAWPEEMHVHDPSREDAQILFIARFYILLNELQNPAGNSASGKEER